MGSRSRSSTSSSSAQTTENRQIGVSDVTGFGIATESGDVEINQQTTDFGAIQGAVDIAGGALDLTGEFADEAFAFARDIGSQSVQTAQKALDTTGQAIVTVGNATRSDTSETLRKLGLYAAIAAAIIFGARAFTKR